MKVPEILEQFPRKRALVVGDICLDRWCTYDPAYSEPSRETGIPRLAVVATEITPGAGGTVANNLVALEIGAVSVLGAIGADVNGQGLVNLLNIRGISPELLVQSPDLVTFTYTKFTNAQTGLEDQPRVDFINTRQLPANVERQVLTHLQTFWSAFDVIFVSDQAETQRGGVVTPAVRNLISELAGQHPEKVFWVDSRVRSELFRNVILKPNESEAATACTSLFGRVDYGRLRKEVNARVIYVTRGPQGVLVVAEERETLVPTRAVEKPVDICGAGDSFSAGAAIALAITGSPLDAARVGNVIASVTIMKKGTGTASVEEAGTAAAEIGW
jgi:rfaE bifunctional protein kinase chain/domain